MNDQRILEIYEKKATKHGDYNAVLDASDNPISMRANMWHDYFLKREMAVILKPKNTDVLLDFGTGVGRLSIFFSPLVSKIVGIDVSQKMLDIAKKKQPKNVEYLLASDFYTQKNRDDQFDKIYSCWVLASISNELLKESIKQLYPALKSGGKFVFLEQTKKNDLFEGDNHVKRSVRTYIKMFEEEGFVLEEYKHAIRIPAYTMNFWKKNSWLPKAILPAFYLIEKRLLNRKPEFIDYYTTAFVFKKQKKSLNLFGQSK